MVFYGQQRLVALCADHFHLFDVTLEQMALWDMEPRKETSVMRAHVLDWARHAGDATPKGAQSAYQREGWDD